MTELDFKKHAPLFMIGIIGFITIIMKLQNLPFFIILIVDLGIFGVLFGNYLIILFEDGNPFKNPNKKGERNAK